MENYDFWDSWKNKTEIENKAIVSIKKARNLIIKVIPGNVLVAIYIKGSFARREMKKGSDVDMVPIVTENKYEDAVFSVNSSEIEPVVIVPLSLWELEHNELWSKSDHTPDLRAKPDRFLKKLSEYKLIYGNPLDPLKFFIREDKHALEEEIKIIQDGYIPAYESGRIEFSSLLKEVFWLVELEQNFKGKKVKHSFEGILMAVDDKDHIVHEAFKFRTGEYKIDKEKKAFIFKLKKYLSSLKKLI
jgi:hypothetical protein